jgi:hypothetical protein
MLPRSNGAIGVASDGSAKLRASTLGNCPKECAVQAALMLLCRSFPIPLSWFRSPLNTFSPTLGLADRREMLFVFLPKMNRLI